MFLQKTECKTNLNQLKPKVNDTYKKNGNKSTNFEPSNPEDKQTKVI